MASPESPYYTAQEEEDIFTSWGNTLMDTDSELAETLIHDIITKSVFPPQLPR